MPDTPASAAAANRNLEQAIHELRATVSTSIDSQRELSNTLKELQSEIKDTYVRKDVLDPTLEALRDDIKSHGDWITWATRIVLALVITAVVGYALANGGK